MSRPGLSYGASQAHEGVLRAQAYGATDPGRVREENQDNFTILDPSDAASRERKGIMAVVADGMGGLTGGATASRIAIETIREAYPESELPPGDALKAAVLRANLQIHAHAEGLPDQEPMGSTVTALAIVDRSVWIAHVGDSRAYRLPPSGTIGRCTRDHTWVEELANRGELDPGSLQYSLHRNVLTRGLGLREEVEVDLVELDDLVPGDTFLLCSDGLHEMVEDVEIETRLRARGGDLRAAATDLINLARDRGGPDNITVLIVRLEAEGAARREPVPTVEQVVRSQHAASGPLRRLFPHSAWIWVSWLLAFALGAASILLLERAPGRPNAIDELLENQGYGEVFNGREGKQLRRLLEEARARMKDGSGR